MNSKVSYLPTSPSKLLCLIQEKANDHLEKIDRNILDEWRWFHVKHKELGGYNAAPSNCFLAGMKCGTIKAIQPAVKEAIKDVLDFTADLCRKHGLSPKQYFDEAALVLEGLIDSIVWEIIEIDKKLRQHGHSKKLGRISEDEARETFGVPGLQSYLHDQAGASLFLAQHENKSDSDGDPQPQSGKRTRKSKEKKIADISTHLLKSPYATSREVSDATDIHESDVRRLWGPIKKAMKDPKRPKPRGSKSSDGTLEAEDK